jgi:ADP-ribosylglycohydrolase
MVAIWSSDGRFAPSLQEGADVDRGERIALAERSLEGLSVGDAFGEQFFGNEAVVMRRIAARELTAAPWPVTDDTVMAMSIVDVLRDCGYVEQHTLAALFAARYRLDPSRGYGPGAHRLLSALLEGWPWRRATREAFGGEGSLGNGGAMRAAPVGAFYADDYAQAAQAALLSAEVTHSHPEGQAGAAAVAVAAAWFARGRTDAAEMFSVVIAHTPAGDTRRGIEAAASLDLSRTVEEAAALLGSGQRVTAQDTVPYCLWMAARHRKDFEEAMWQTVSGLGDRDTTCAIVAGILATRPGNEVPSDWLAARERLSVFRASS